MTAPPPAVPEPVPLAARAARITGWIAAFFCFTVVLVMTLSWVQAQRYDPLDLDVLERLRARIDASPEDETLRRDFREVDRLARQAFFTTQYRLRTGAGLLAGGVAVMLAAFHAHRVLGRRDPHPARFPEEPHAWQEARAARRIIAAGALALWAAWFAAGLVARPPAPEILKAGDPPAEQEPVMETALAVHTLEELPPPAEPAAPPVNAWPNFRGPGGLGVAPAADPPLVWDGATGVNVRWKTEVPRPGYSSPVVWGDRVFLTGGDETAREVYCFDAGTGALRWRAEIPTQADTLPEVTEDTGFAAATVATDGLRVYAVFATGDLVGLDFEGREIWRRHLGVPDNPYGHSSSLLVHDGLLFVQFDHHLEAVLLALDAATGATRWEVERDVISWASPILFEWAGQPHLALLSSRSVAAYDPATGRQLWQEDCMGGEVGASPAHTDGMLIAANEYAVGAGLRLDPGGGRAEIVWEIHDNLPDVASPVAAQGLVFLATSYGDVTCLEAASGTSLWIEEFPRGFYASPLIAAGRVYALDRDGRMRIFSAARAYEPLGEAELGQPAVATPAFAGNRIYIRGTKHLFAIEEE